jgi:DNA helicase-2/ATP-dependent DNA helicase PcrA
MRFSDVKPIAKQKQMKYVVIDEAQDISPLMLRILRKYMPNAQFSLYGDIAQNIFQDGPSMSWTTMADAFGLPQTVPQYLLTTYRSTKPIMEYAAQVLNRFPIPDYRYANAVMTSDKQPRHIRLASYDELVKYIYQSHQNQPTVSHAVIFKTKQDASYFLEQCLQPHHKKTFAWYDANQLQHPDTIRVIHAAIAKGLEFDVVYLADVDANTYPSDDFHSRVLYVMITRAAKELHVITRTTFSPLINAH